MKKAYILLIGNEGSALVITLLVIATLTALVLSFSEESDIELNLSAFSRDGYLAAQTARSGIFIGLSVLERDDNREMDSMREDWGSFGADSFPEGLTDNASLTGSLIDENGKLNINLLRNSNGDIGEKDSERLKRLFRALELDENMADPFLDWLDKDDIERMRGAENSYYQGLEESYPCSNGPFLTKGQIALVKGFKEMGVNLDDYLTIYSDGLVNINTAPVQVLQSLDDEMDKYLAEAIVEYREERDFTNTSELKNVPGLDEDLYKRIAPLITVKSTCFSIRMRGVCRGAVSEIKAVAVRENNEHHLIYWKVM
ncbi:type II secretion system minor pseudopilin GspK [Thermodesulfobacteriota bacterium]